MISELWRSWEWTPMMPWFWHLRAEIDSHVSGHVPVGRHVSLSNFLTICKKYIMLYVLSLDLHCGKFNNYGSRDVEFRLEEIWRFSENHGNDCYLLKPFDFVCLCLHPYFLVLKIYEESSIQINHQSTAFIHQFHHKGHNANMKEKDDWLKYI